MKPGWLASGQRPAVLETYTTMVVQALDQGIVVPLAFLTGVLLLKGNAGGYALASIVLIKVTTLGTAVLSMALFRKTTPEFSMSEMTCARLYFKRKN